MKSKNITYFASQATKSFFRNGLMSVTSVFTVVACLFIFGLFLVVSMNLNSIVQQIREDAEIQAFIVSGTEVEGINSIRSEIEQLDNVNQVVLFTKEDALSYMKEVFADDSMALEGLDKDNPFQDTFKISLEDLSLAKQTAASVKAVAGVESVENKQEVLDGITSVTNVIKMGSFWIMLALGVVAIFIISNTIKLTVFARRKEIGIMKFVGATDGFIRWPFVIEGIIIGLVGAAFAYGIVAWGYISCLNLLKNLDLGDLFVFLNFDDLWKIIAATFAAIGMLIGAIGSGLSIRKYLNV